MTAVRRAFSRTPHSNRSRESFRPAYLVVIVRVLDDTDTTGLRVRVRSEVLFLRRVALVPVKFSKRVVNLKRKNFREKPPGVSAADARRRHTETRDWRACARHVSSSDRSAGVLYVNVQEWKCWNRSERLSRRTVGGNATLAGRN